MRFIESNKQTNKANTLYTIMITSPFYTFDDPGEGSLVGVSGVRAKSLTSPLNLREVIRVKSKVKKVSGIRALTLIQIF